jgi:hypothetical protein
MSLGVVSKILIWSSVECRRAVLFSGERYIRSLFKWILIALSRVIGIAQAQTCRL